jgi:hypothetical protein
MLSRKEIAEQIKESEILIEQSNSNTKKLVLEIYDLFEVVFESASKFYLNGIVAPPHDYDRNRICFAALYKGLLGLYNAIDCTLTGRVGLAFLSLRQVVEFLIVSKAAVLDDSGRILNSWNEGKGINMQRDLYNHMKLTSVSKMQLEQFKDFFRMLGSFVHSTRGCQQVSHKYEVISEDVKTAFSLILVIFQMYRHLLFSVYMPKLNWYLSFYCPDIVDKRKRLLSLLDEDKKNQSEAAKRVINFYKKTWFFKQ